MSDTEGPKQPDPAGAAAPGHGPGPAARRATLPVVVGALGVVFGDIGTSPLYTIRECFHGDHAVEVTQANVLGVLSLVFWALMAVVSFKYLVFILRADNKGEGGMFALLALMPGAGKVLGGATLAALFGASLLFGDGIITPAISVLSAVEGLEVATDAAKGLVVPITCLLLFGLFSVQKHGTGGIGRAFGPVMVTWFVTIGLIGLAGTVRNLQVLAALNPVHAVAFFVNNGSKGAVVVGSVVLAVTGAEALYADLGHFGRRPIRLSWFWVVLPALLLNYFGQGALLLSSAEKAANPFYGLVPRPLLIPMVVLATSATVIASQALISGVFSMTRQAVQLGFLPRLKIVHTSGETVGQIYVPAVNRALMVACIGLVLVFRRSTELAGAYGVAVTTDMVISSVLFYLVARRAWGWRRLKAVPLVGLFLVFELSFLSSTLLKVLDGGWFPLAVAAGMLVVMTTWRDGRTLLARQMVERTLPLSAFIEDVTRSAPIRVPGVAVFMSSSPEGAPPALLHHFKHNKVLHQRIAVLSIRSAESPYVEERERVEVRPLGEGFFRVIATYGFMESPNVAEVLQRAATLGLAAEPNQASYFLGRETMLTSGKEKMAPWRKALFAFLSRNAQPATAWFGLPPGRVVELGMQIEL